MQGPSTETQKAPESKIVPLFKARQEQQKADAESTCVNASAQTSDAPKTESFSDVMRRNAENIERLRKERSKANQSVLKSYKLKN